MNACAVPENMGAVRNMLAAVDCNTSGFAQAGYQALTGAGSPFQMALTIVLTLYVAVIGYRLLLAPDSARLSDGPVAALKIGLVLALVTNWNLFQLLVHDVSAKLPLEIASLLSAPLDRNATLTTDPAGGLQVAYDQLSLAAAAFAKIPAHADVSQALTAAAYTVFMISAGLVAVATIAIAVLTAIGPLFIAAMLFLQTRGLFTGWLRALAASAFALFSAWMLVVLMLFVLEPWLLTLAQQRQDNAPDAQQAMTAVAIVFVFAACQLGLMIAGLVVAGGFSFTPRRARATPPQQRAPAATVTVPALMVSRATRLAETLQQETGSWAVRRMMPAAAVRAASAAFPVRDGGNFYRRPAVTRREDKS